jgi:hypothetical protein
MYNINIYTNIYIYTNSYLHICTCVCIYVKSQEIFTCRFSCVPKYGNSSMIFLLEDESFFLVLLRWATFT